MDKVVSSVFTPADTPVTIDPDIEVTHGGLCINGRPINLHEHRTVHLHGWTWAAFMDFIQYECMFVGALKRTQPNTSDDGVQTCAARFSGERLTTGYAGHGVRQVVNIYLYTPDGDIPPMPS